jgi:Zn-dependent protease with chaperone function
LVDWRPYLERLATRSSDALFDELKRAPPTRSQRRGAPRSPSLLAAYAIAGAVHLGSVLLLVASVAVWVVPWPNLFVVMAALTLPLLAWSLRPRIVAAPQELLSRSAFPALYRAADRIADAMHAPHPEAIGISCEFNANFRRAGWRARSYIELGIPLMLLARPDERLAIVAHELSHGVNGDPLRGRFLFSAVATLERWAEVVRPLSIGSAAHGVSFGGPLVSLVVIPFELAMLGLARLLDGVAQGVMLLVLRESQRAEYWADRLAASVVGTDVMQDALRMLAMLDAAESAQRQQAFDGGIGDLAALLAGVRTNTPASEIARIEQLSRHDRTRVDLTHPPTALRLDMLAAWPAQAAAIEFDASDQLAIEQELLSLMPATQRELTNRYVVG